MKLFRMSQSIRSCGISLWLEIEIFWMVGIILLKLEDQPNRSTSIYLFIFTMNYLIGALMTRIFLWRYIYIFYIYIHVSIYIYICSTMQCFKCCDFVSFSFHYLLIKYDFHWCYPNYIMHVIPQWNKKSICEWQ